MRLRRSPAASRRRTELRSVLDAAQREMADAEIALRDAHAQAVVRWADADRAERPPADVRQAVAREASAEQFARLARARAELEVARRAYWAAQGGGG